MRKHGLIAIIAALSLAGCGTTKIVTLTTSGSAPASPSSAGSGASAGMGGTTSAVAACFKAGGARVRGPQAAGRGLADYVTLRDGQSVGFVKAPNAFITHAIARVFTQKGAHVTVLNKDRTAFRFSSGPLPGRDSRLLRKCSRRR